MLFGCSLRFFFEWVFVWAHVWVFSLLFWSVGCLFVLVGCLFVFCLGGCLDCCLGLGVVGCLGFCLVTGWDVCLRAGLGGDCLVMGGKALLVRMYATLNPSTRGGGGHVDVSS